MNDMKGVQCLHPIKQIFLELLVVRLSDIFTMLHGKLNAVVVADDVEPQYLLEVGTHLQGRGDLVKDELSQHLINLEVESSSVSRLYLLRLDHTVPAIDVKQKYLGICS